MSDLPVQQETEEGCDAEGYEPSPLLDYLETEKGHQIASRVLSILEGIQQATLATNSKHVIFELWFKVITVVLVIIAASILTWFDRFNPTMGVLFGTLMGYVFGKKS